MNEDIKKTINKIIFTHATTKQWPTISSRLVLLKRGRRASAVVWVTGPTRPAECSPVNQRDSAGESGASGSESTWRTASSACWHGCNFNTPRLVTVRASEQHFQRTWTLPLACEHNSGAAAVFGWRQLKLQRSQQNRRRLAGFTVAPPPHSQHGQRRRLNNVFVTTSPLPTDETVSVCLSTNTRAQ